MTAPARLSILASAVLFSTGGVAIKACTLPSWQVASFRSACAALALVFLLPDGRTRWMLQTVAIGSAYAAVMILFVLATKLTTAASTIFLQSTAPLYVFVSAAIRVTRLNCAGFWSSAKWLTSGSMSGPTSGNR